MNLLPLVGLPRRVFARHRRAVTVEFLMSISPAVGEAMTTPDDENTIPLRLGIAELIRHLALVGLAGALSGVVAGGIGGRLVMRIAAVAAHDGVIGSATENGNRIGDITAGGTIALVIFVGILFGGVGAIAYLISENWLRWAGRWRHLLFALFLLVIGAPTTLVPGNFDFSLVGNQGLVVGMFLALFLLFGIPMAWLVDSFERRFPRVNPDRPERSVAGYVVIMSLGTLSLLLFVLMLFVESVCGCEPNYITGAFLIGLGVTTIMARSSQLTTALPWRLTSVAKTAAYVLFVGAVSAGSVRTWSDVAAIL